MDLCKGKIKSWKEMLAEDEELRKLEEDIESIKQQTLCKLTVQQQKEYSDIESAINVYAERRIEKAFCGGFKLGGNMVMGMLDKK